MNNVRIKYGMARWIRDHNEKHPKDTIELAKMRYIPLWGSGAKTNFWRISQKVHIDYKPKPTQALADLLFPPSFGDMVVRVALGEVGVKEHPPNSNDGPRVHVYQATTGAYKQPWCASGRKWCEMQAAKALGITLKWFANPAWVPNWTAAAGGNLFKEVGFDSAEPGDYVTLWGSQHIETVVRRAGDYLLCVGFNTSPVGQNSNGGMVARTKRHRSEVTKIGRRRGV